MTANDIAAGDTAPEMAQKLVNAMTNAGLAASHHPVRVEQFDGYLVLVNRATEVDFRNRVSAPGATFEDPAWDYAADIDAREGALLSLNFRDDFGKRIDIFAAATVGENVKAWAGNDALGAFTPALQNLTFLPEAAVDTDDIGLPFTPGHELGHILLNQGNDLHEPEDATNLLAVGNRFGGAGTDTVEAYGASKRLNEDQQTRARNVSGPGSNGPVLLQKK